MSVAKQTNLPGYSLLTSVLAKFRNLQSFSFQDINSPTDSVIGRDFQELSAEEQERQREEWKAELKKTEEEILTLKQVLTAKERHAAGEAAERRNIQPSDP